MAYLPKRSIEKFSIHPIVNLTIMTINLGGNSMKRATIRLFKTYDGIIRWLSSESFLGLKNGGMVLFGGFLIAGLLCSVFRYEYIQQKVVTLYFFIAFFVFLLYKPFVNDRTIERFTRGRYKSASEWMQNINHFSYLYGLIIFSIEISVFVDIISILIQLFLFDKASTVNLIYLVIESMLVFTALYFLYHLYVSDADGRLEKMKLNIQLYSVVGITFSPIMLIIGDDNLFKILITSILAEYGWIQYFIANEEKIVSSKQEPIEND